MFDVVRGTIIEYSEFKLYGYILGDNTITYYFHKTDCIKFSPEIGQVVKAITTKDFLDEPRLNCITKV